MSYKFHHRRLGVQLLDEQTLTQQSVVEDDIVRIQPEITAGGESCLASARIAITGRTLIEWWDQQRVRNARILVIGAGALGNEILKLLALVGAGSTLVFDPDRIERSNLSRTCCSARATRGSSRRTSRSGGCRRSTPRSRRTRSARTCSLRGGLGRVRVGGRRDRRGRQSRGAGVHQLGVRARRQDVGRWRDRGAGGVVRVFDRRVRGLATSAR